MALPQHETEPARQSQASTCHPSPENLRMAFELHEAGRDIKRQQLRREHPELNDDRIESLLLKWLRREGEPGDAPGRVRALQRVGP